MAVPADSRLAIVTIGGVLGLMLGLGFGHWQQQRTLALVEARQAADRAAFAELVQRLGERLDGLRDELVDDRQTGQSERQHLSVRIHALSTAVDELRVLTQPVVADLPESAIESAAPAGIQ
jgi:hypothetical protein